MSLDDALRKPTPDPITIPAPRAPMTGEVRVGGHTAEIVESSARTDAEGHEALRAAGLDPREWRAIAYRVSEWTMHGGEQGLSTRWGFERKPEERPSPPGPPLDDLLAAIAHRPAVVAADRTDGEYGYIVALGDTQFGKIDGDGVEGTLRRALDCLDQARALFDLYDERFGIGSILVSFLGDHVEGFVSQAGGNTWRTPLTLNEQIRLTRRVMLHATQLFADCGAARVTLAAVPGNHGEAVRLNGKMATRYDDSHDCESLVAVAEAASLDPARFGHCRFMVPDTDELVIVAEVAGTTVGMAHGHQWRPGAHRKWWQGQAFGSSPLRHAELLLAGHLHHLHVESEDGRTFVQVPALEAESTWWRHSTGTGGDPGVVVAVTRDGVTPVIEVVRPG